MKLPCSRKIILPNLEEFHCNFPSAILKILCIKKNILLTSALLSISHLFRIFIA